MDPRYAARDRRFHHPAFALTLAGIEEGAGGRRRLRVRYARIDRPERRAASASSRSLDEGLIPSDE